MQRAIQPITPETFTKFKNFVVDVSSRKECGSIIFLNINKREQIFRATQLQKDLKNLEIIDLNNGLFDDPEDLGRIQNHQKATYLLLQADCLLDEKRFFLPQINQLIKQSNLSLIFFFNINITFPWNIKKLSPYHYLFQNLYHYSAYQEKDQRQFIKYLENKFVIEIPEKIKKLIVAECSGSLWLIKEAVRFYLKTKNTKKILNHQEMIFRLKTLWEELSSEEKSYLQKKVTKNSSLTRDENIIANYYKQQHFSIPLLEKYVAARLASETVIKLNSEKKIELNSVIIDSFFSQKERSALRYLLLNTSRLVNRNTLAGVIWGENNEFTDWALDQFIKRLRSKFSKLGLNKNLLKTVKNQGFIFQQ